MTSIIFCTALSEYDQVLLEERNQVRASFFQRGLRADESCPRPSTRYPRRTTRTEPDAGVARAVRLGHQLAVVPPDVDHPVLEQD